MKLLETKALSKSYSRRPVVRQVDLHIDIHVDASGSGEIVGLLGPNGAGKSTIFRMIVGLVKPDSGQVLFNGEDATRLPMSRRARLGMGYLPQESSVFQKMTVAENIMAILETQRLRRQERNSRLKTLLEELGLQHLAGSKAYTLSGGERRRLEITRALATEPMLLLLDEPFAGVDPITVDEIQEILRQLRSRGISILITDHNVRETLDITDRSYIINEGNILVSGTYETIVGHPEARRLYLGQRFGQPAPPRPPARPVAPILESRTLTDDEYLRHFSADIDSGKDARDDAFDSE